MTLDVTGLDEPATGYLLHVVISRKIALQREQIATLRAFGYTRREIAWRFLGMALLLGLAGTLLGTALGARLGADLTALYTQFFRFPQLRYQLDWRVAAGAALFGLSAVAAGAVQAVLEGRRLQAEVLFAAVLDDYLDLNAYLHLDALHRLLGEEDAVSGAFLQVDAAQEQRLYRELKRTPRVAGVSIKRAALASYRKTMGENLLRMKAIHVAFAAIVAVGVVYNCARISLAERSRELATWRVLGFTREETARVLLGELAVLVAAAIPVGRRVGGVCRSSGRCRAAKGKGRSPERRARRNTGRAAGRRCRGAVSQRRGGAGGAGSPTIVPCGAAAAFPRRAPRGPGRGANIHAVEENA